MSRAAPADGTVRHTGALCRACGRALHPLRGGGEVVHGTVAAAPVGPLGWACPAHRTDAGDDHDVLAPTVAEAQAALDESLDVARRTRVRGRLRCGACDAPFPLPGRRTTRTITITGAAPAVTVTLDVPVLRCTTDAVDNVPPEAARDAATAVAQLLGGAP